MKKLIISIVASFFIFGNANSEIIDCTKFEKIKEKLDCKAENLKTKLNETQSNAKEKIEKTGGSIKLLN